MNRVTYLFLVYFLACIGYGFGKVYWDDTKSSYIIITIAVVIVILTIRSSHYHSKEAHSFYRKQAFWTSVILLMCSMVDNGSKPLIAFHTGISMATVVSIAFWFSTIFNQSDDNPHNQRMMRTRRDNFPPLAWYFIRLF